ncbi:MAG: aminoglycoside phosphotransferase family protein [Bacteroidales bacterium]
MEITEPLPDEKVILSFLPQTESIEVSPYGSGHIHRTYRVMTDQGEYILQEINHTVFKDVEGLMANISLVTQHLKQHFSDERFGWDIPEVIPATGGESYLTHEGKYWRLYRFIKDSITYDHVESAGLAAAGGEAFGHFTAAFSGFNPRKLNEVIPGFHDAFRRLSGLERAVSENRAGRLNDCRSEVESLMEQKEEMTLLARLAATGEIPFRVVHNDTKVNNILFSSQGRVLSVIDLDTVMPGLVHFDFGDAVRTWCNAGDEDASDPDTIAFRKDIFNSFAGGFFSVTLSVLNQAEKETLWRAPFYMAWEQALRFLTDFLNGDTYYPVRYETHNLVRTRAQLRWLDELKKNEPYIRKELSSLLS